MIILDLIQNIAILVALAAAYLVIANRINRKTVYYQVTIGLLFGGVGILGMMTPMNFAPGIIFDGRSIILGIAGMFGGPWVALIAGLATAAYRIWLGGGGALVGVTVITESAAIGVLFYYFRRRFFNNQLPIWALVVFGYLIHILMTVIVLGLPDGAGLLAVQQLGPYFLTIYPLGTVLVGMLFLDYEAKLRSRQQLERSQAALTRAQQVAKLGSWVWHIKSNTLDWSDEMYTIFGIDKASFTGSLSDVIAAAIHPDDRAAVEASNQRVAVEGEPVPLEYRVIRPDGSIRTVWAEAGQLVKDEHGQPVRLSGIVQDITERREIENAILEGENRYRNLAMHSPDAIMVNHMERIVLVNQACIELFGAKSEADLLGKSPFDLFHPDDHEQIRQRIHVLRDLGQVVPVVEERIVRLDGRVVDVDVVGAPFQSSGFNDIHVILRDITQRKQNKQQLIQQSELLRQAYDATLQGWSNALELRERETAGHSKRVVKYTLALAQQLGIPEQELVHIQRGALLHDIGKMGIPDSILLKPGPLSADEWVVMRQHPVYAYDLLKKIPYLAPALDIPHYHHEKWDGSGYPDGLRGEDIPLAARIFAIVDVWDALSHDRPYRLAWPPREVRQYLHEQSGVHFDPRVVEGFVQILEAQQPA